MSLMVSIFSVLIESIRRIFGKSIDCNVYKKEMNCNDENGLQKIICDIGIGAWNVCKVVCFKVVCEGDFCMLLFVFNIFFFYL